MVCYGFSLNDGKFVFDDSVAIQQNGDVTTDSPIRQIFEHDFWGYNITDRTSHKSYRPLTIAMFRAEYQILGELNPIFMKSINLALHTIISCGLLGFYKIFLGDQSDVSFFAALLFGTFEIGYKITINNTNNLFALSIYTRCPSDTRGSGSRNCRKGRTNGRLLILDMFFDVFSHIKTKRLVVGLDFETTYDKNKTFLKFKIYGFSLQVQDGFCGLSLSALLQSQFYSKKMVSQSFQFSSFTI